MACVAASATGASGASARMRAGARTSRLLTAAVVGVCAYAGFLLRDRYGRAFIPGLQRGGRHAIGLRRATEVAEAKTDTNEETFEFAAEVDKVMDIIINSLYSNKDVFLRELVSNSADACDKKRFMTLTDTGSGEVDVENMKLQVKPDKKARTLTVEDSGVGMRKDELKQNLGRIARSGTANFVQNLQAGDKNDVSLIGQFGVGFYSAFLVADKVQVYSRSFQDPEGERKTYMWESVLGGSYTIKEQEPPEPFLGEQSGTKIVLHLKEEAQEYLDSGKLGDLLKKYSEFITFPIELWNQKVEYDQVPDLDAPPPKEGQPQKMKSVPRAVFQWEVQNKQKPIWLRSPEIVNQTEYAEFYKATFKAFDEPLTVTHFKVEGQIEFRALMFIPTTMPFELTRDMFSDQGRAMRLYVKRVFINDKFEDLVPRWLTFVRGVVDSEDLPLNVGREILQKSRTLKIIRKRIVRKVLDTLEQLAQDAPAKFDTFWTNYGKYFKVGLVEDMDYKDELKHVVRFWSSKNPENMTSLSQYVERMQPGQEKIYFVTGEGKKAVETSPAMEKMRSKNLEVLYMVDPLDEIASQSINDYDGHKMVDINKAGFDFNMTEAEKQERESSEKQFEPLQEFLKKKLGERVQKVALSDRLVDSPAMLVQGEWGMSPMMQRYMKAQATSGSQDQNFNLGSMNQAILEINAQHPIIQKLKLISEKNPDSDDTMELVTVLYETAALQGGYTLDNAAEYAKRVNMLIQDKVGSAAGSAGISDAEVVTP